MHDLSGHVRFASRQLRRSPGFTLTAVLTLAIGIGAASAIFSIFYGVLLHPLPYPKSERLVKITPLVDKPGTDLRIDNEVSYPNFQDWRDRAHNFESMASYNRDTMVLGNSGGAPAKNIQTSAVSADFFHVLGVAPAIGRTFTRKEEKERVVILSHDLWVSDFHSSSAVLGQTIKLSDELFTVVGVLPEDTSFPFVASTPVEAWTTPIVDAGGKNPSTEQRGWNQLDVIARLKPGVTLSQAEAEMNTIQRNLAAQYPNENANQTSARVKPELEEMVGDIRPALRILFAAVGALLLIACANVAGLLLARGSSRQGELAVRAALGASRGEITTQLLAEALLLSLLGGAAGIVLAEFTLKGFLQFVPKSLPRLESIAINGPVLAFSIFVSVLTGILFGLLPARRLSRLDPAMALREGTRTATSGRKQHRLHSALVVSETALGMVLLVGAGLFIRSFMRLTSTDPGFNAEHVLTFRIGMTEKAYPPEKQALFFDQLLARLKSLPGVKDATAAFPMPFSGGNMSLTFSIEHRAVKPGEEAEGRATVIEPDYFQTLQVPLLHGRFLNAYDNQKTSPPVMVINEALAQKYFPGEDALGRRLETGFDADDQGKVRHWREIVGVVGNVKRVAASEPAAPEYYVPFGQAQIITPYVALRVTGEPASYSNAVIQAVEGLDKELPVYRVRTMQEGLAASSSQPRFQTLLLSCFASIALLLAAIGLYAVLSYMVVQRTHEIGLRMALGAQRSSVMNLILHRGMALAGIGVAIGLCIAAALTRFLNSMLYEVKPLDAVTFISVAALLLAVSAISSFLPAMRAASLDPMKTLRDQ